jgi:hypothetical protein
MNETEFLKWVIMACLGGFVWLVKRAVNSSENTIKDLQEEIKYIKDKYLHKDDFREFKTELRGMFEEIRSDIKQLRNHNG